MLPKKRIIEAYITHASFETVINTIMALGHARQSDYVCVASVHMLMEAYWNKSFREILNHAVLATPDGRPISIAMNLIYGTRQEQIAGHRLMIGTLAKAEEKGLSVFFYGATDDVLSSLCETLHRNHPNLRIAGTYAPPFRPLTPDEDEAVVRLINDSGAHVVMVALGCPKQEIWMAAHQYRVHGVMMGVGAAFPFYTGHVKRAPEWMQRWCLEWFFRICMEPRRLFWRYMSTNPLFLALFLWQWITMRLLNRTHDGCLTVSGKT